MSNTTTTKPRRWSAEEIDIVRQHNGSPDAALAALLAAGFDRTRKAVESKMVYLRSTGRLEDTKAARSYGVLVARIEAALERRGDMTRREISDAIGVEDRLVAGVIGRMMRSGRIHIADWTMGHTGQRIYPRPVYSAGPGENAQKPKRKHAKREASKRYRDIRGCGVSNVFDLGLTPRKRMEIKRRRAREMLAA